MNGKTMSTMELSSITILGIRIDRKLTFSDHVVAVTSNAARKLSCIRRVSHLLDARGCSTLYKSQVQSLMEYCPLSWDSCPVTYLNKLESVRKRAQRLIFSKLTGEDQQQYRLPPLSHRRNLVGMCVMYKVHKLGVPHLSSLRCDAATTTQRRTRRANESLLRVPPSRSEQHLRTFLPKFTRLWNCMMLTTDLKDSETLQMFKEGVHRWLQESEGN